MLLALNIIYYLSEQGVVPKALLSTVKTYSAQLACQSNDIGLHPLLSAPPSLVVLAEIGGSQSHLGQI